MVGFFLEMDLVTYRVLGRLISFYLLLTALW